MSERINKDELVRRLATRMETKEKEKRSIDLVWQKA
jgi:hypothetical protein